MPVSVCTEEKHFPEMEIKAGCLEECYLENSQADGKAMGSPPADMGRGCWEGLVSLRPASHMVGSGLAPGPSRDSRVSWVPLPAVCGFGERRSLEHAVTSCEVLGLCPIQRGA